MSSFVLGREFSCTNQTLLNCAWFYLILNCNAILNLIFPILCILLLLYLIMDWLLFFFICNHFFNFFYLSLLYQLSYFIFKGWYIFAFFFWSLIIIILFFIDILSIMFNSNTLYFILSSHWEFILVVFKSLISQIHLCCECINWIYLNLLLSRWRLFDHLALRCRVYILTYYFALLSLDPLLTFGILKTNLFFRFLYLLLLFGLL